MKKLLFTPVVLGFVLLPAFGADPVVTTPPPPANVTPPTTPPTPVENRVIVPLRTLTVVKDARERRTPWQDSADMAVARISNPAIKSNVSQQLAAVAPQVAKALMSQPSETAIVTVAVFKQRGSDHQMLAAVAFEGVGESLNPSFYARVLANFPQLPGTDPKLAETLELDPGATSYLCLFLDHGDLKADDVADAQMKKSLDIGIEEAQKAGEFVGSAPAEQPVAISQPPVVAQQPNAAVANGPDYTNTYWDSSAPDYSPYYGVDGWIPWFSYVPVWGQPAQIVRPDFQRREHWIRHDEAVAAADHQQAVAREHPNVLEGARTPDQNMRRLVLPSAPRNARGPLPVAPREPQGPIQGAHEPSQVLPPAHPQGAPAHAEPAPAHAVPARR